MRDWNVLVTVREEGWGRALQLLRRWGAVAGTRFYNVLVMRVEDPRELLEAVRQALAAAPGTASFLARVAPAQHRFTFETREEFEAHAAAALQALAPALAGKAFHVRVHRRGHQQEISGHAEERRLAGLVLEAVGPPAHIAFEDPDAVVALDLVGSEAGVSLWTREELQRYPFLRPG